MSRYLEISLRNEHTLIISTLLLVVLIAAVYTVAGVGMEMSAISMTFGKMDGMGAMATGSMEAMPMAADWSGLQFLAMFLMWWLMMIAMMLPSASPAILLYASILKAGRLGTSTARPAMVFTGGYLLVWAGFSLAATVVQLKLETSGLVSPNLMMLITGPAGAMVVIAVVVYQFTPLKNRCLTLCRAPAEFIARHHRPGPFGAIRLGVLHGAYCLGCCVALMALLFVGGVMNLLWIVGLAAFVALEKLGPRDFLFSRAAGVLLIGYGLFQLGLF